MTPAAAIAGARIILNDPDDGSPRWTNAVLLRYWNDYYKGLARNRPDLFQEIQELTLVAGVIQMVSRETTFGFGTLLFNQKGEGVRPVDKLSMELQSRSWRKDAAGAVQVWSRVEGDAFRFYVWPQAKAGDIVTAMIPVVPADIAIGAIGNNVPNVSDAFRASAESFIAGRALTINTNAADTAKGATLLDIAAKMGL